MGEGLLLATSTAGSSLVVKVHFLCQGVSNCMERAPTFCSFRQAGKQELAAVSVPSPEHFAFILLKVGRKTYHKITSLGPSLSCLANRVEKKEGRGFLQLNPQISGS